MTLYLTRHGETEWNAQNKVCGITDVDQGFLNNKRCFAFRYPGGVCRVINAYFRDMSNEEFFHYLMGNCGLEEYEL